MVDDFLGGKVFSEEDIASPNLEIGSTVAYARLPIGWRKMGRADARRRDVAGRTEAIVGERYPGRDPQ